MDFNQIEKNWQKQANEQMESVTTEMWEQLNNKLDSTVQKSSKHNKQWMMMVAASLVGLAVIAFIAFQPKTTTYHADILAYDQSSNIIANEDLATVSNDFYNVSQVMVLHQAYDKLETNTIR
jgi:nicotinamide riboside transporter PnuC